MSLLVMQRRWQRKVERSIIIPGINLNSFGHSFSRSGLKAFGTVSLELMTFTLPGSSEICHFTQMPQNPQVCNATCSWGAYDPETPVKPPWQYQGVMSLPLFSKMVNIAPPPIPILWGCTREVHSSAAMAPSTADPPRCNIFLYRSKHSHVTHFPSPVHSHIQTHTHTHAHTHSSSA